MCDRPVMSVEEYIGKVRAKYRATYPLLGTYWDVIAEHEGPRVSINEPWTGGIEQRAAVRIALARISRPARDEEDVRHAVAFIEQLTAEMDSEMPPVARPIRSYVIDEFIQYAGCTPIGEDWENGVIDEVEREYAVTNIVAAIPTDRLRDLMEQTLGFAMPAILRHITELDAAGPRNPAVFTNPGAVIARQSTP